MKAMGAPLDEELEELLDDELLEEELELEEELLLLAVAGLPLLLPPQPANNNAGNEINNRSFFI